MRRQIKIDNEQFEVTAYKQAGTFQLQVGEGEVLPTQLKQNADDSYLIELGDQSAPIAMVVKGETAYIRAFNQTFKLQIVDPIEQAQQSSGGWSGSARAPMPGIVVEVHVQPGDKVVRGQPLMTIESMKILTVIKAPRDGEVEQLHLTPGQTFDKNAVLVTLIEQ